MSWFKRLFKRPEEYDIFTRAVPASTIYRWYLYDTQLIDDEELTDFSELLGLSRISEEGAEFERQESERRMETIHSLYPYLETMADFSSSVITAMHMQEASENPNVDIEDLEEHFKHSKDIFKAVALSTLVGTLSIGFELGMLESTLISSSYHEPGSDGFEEVNKLIMGDDDE